MSELLVPATAAQLDEMLAGTAGAVLLAGGTDLLVQRRAGRELPVMVDLTNLRDGVPAVRALPGGRLRVSATRPLSEIAGALTGLARLPSVRQAIAVFASAQIRHRATIGGNLGTASPSGDLIPPLVAAGAVVRLRRRGGLREVPIDAFLLGPRRTDCRPGEWIDSVELAPPAGASGFRKIGGRRALAISVVNLAWQWTFRPDRTLQEVRLAVGSAAPTVIRCPSAERVLSGTRLNRAVADEAAAALAGDLSPIDDLRGSADYRRRAGGGLLLEALLPLLAPAAGRSEGPHHGREVV